MAIFGALKYATKYGQIRQMHYLGTPNMVKWGVPENILQNAVQTRFALCRFASFQ